MPSFRHLQRTPVLLALTVSLTAAACNLPRERLAPMPEFSGKGLLGADDNAIAARKPGSGQVPGADDQAPGAKNGAGDDTAADDQGGAEPQPADENADASPTAASALPSVLFSLDGDVVGFLPEIPDTTWRLLPNTSMRILAHVGNHQQVDAMMAVMGAPKVPEFPNVDHFVRWRLLRMGASELSSMARVAWSALFAVTSFAGTVAANNLVSAEDLQSLALMALDSATDSLATTMDANTFTGWRWTGRNRFGYHVRFGEFHGTWGESPLASLGTGTLQGLARSTLAWMQRVPALTTRGGRLLRQLRLVMSAPSITCEPFQPCVLEGPVTEAAAQEAPADAPPAEGPGNLGVLYDAAGNEIARSTAADLEVADGKLRWNWAGGAEGHYLFRWTTGAVGPVDPGAGQALRVDIGKGAAMPARIAIGYVDAGNPEVRGTFMILVCREPCPVAGAFAGMLDNLCARSDTRCMAQYKRPGDADTEVESRMTDLTGDGDTGQGSVWLQLKDALGPVVKAFATDKKQGKAQLERWWQAGGAAAVPGEVTATSGQGVPAQ